MAVNTETNMFAKFSDSIDGDSKVKGYEKQCHIVSMYGGDVMRASVDRMKNHNAVGKAHIGDFTIVKYRDVATTTLKKFCNEGTNIKEVILTDRKDDKILNRKVTLKDVIVLAVHQSGEANGVALDQVQLSFRELKDEAFSDEGGTQKNAGVFEWKIDTQQSGA
jgi:type VI secretion system secreted protein Hcp